MRQIRIEVTIRELLQLIKAGKINMNPAYQRDYIAKDNVTWQQKLVGNIIKDTHIIPNLYARTNLDLLKHQGELTEDQRLEVLESLIEMIDGQQRTRTNEDFANDNFQLDNLRIIKMAPNKVDIDDTDLDGFTATQLRQQHPKLWKRYLDYKFSVVATYGSDTEVHQMFIDLNDLQKMSNQEQRNAIVCAIAEYVRNTARLETHKLFNKEDGGTKGLCMNANFKRMLQDEILVKIISIVEGNAFEAGIAKNALDSLYKRSEYKNNFGLAPKVKRVLNKLYDLLKDRNYQPMITVGTLLNLTMVINDLMFNRSVKVKDWTKVRDWFFETHNRLGELTSSQRAAGLNETIYHQKTRLGSDSDGMNMRRSFLRLEGLYDIGGVTNVDPKRVISDTELQSMWFIANQSCERCGKKVALVDAIKAHQIAHSNGGKTTPSNSFVSCKACNVPEVKDVELKATPA